MKQRIEHIIKRVTTIHKQSSSKTAHEIISEIETIRLHSDIITFTGMPYGNDWRGIYNAALGMFPDALVTVPHDFSRNIYSQKELTAIGDVMAMAKFEKIVFTGYGDCLKALIVRFHSKANGQLRKNVYLIYHGSLSQHAERSNDSQYLLEIIELQQKGLIRKIGFMKKGLAETMNKIAKINSDFLINIISDRIPTISKLPNGVHIGVLTHNFFRKNLHNQIAAALMFQSATVHVREDFGFAYLQSPRRIHIHPFDESYDDFLILLGSMTLNFYVTFSECYGMVIAESLSLGVPCLASNSSGFFDYDDELRKWLVVDDYDNPVSIYNQAMKVLERRSEIAARGKEYINKLNGIAAKKLDAFLND